MKQVLSKPLFLTFITSLLRATAADECVTPLKTTTHGVYFSVHAVIITLHTQSGRMEMNCRKDAVKDSTL